VEKEPTVADVLGFVAEQGEATSADIATTRKKGTEVYRYGVYRCGFAKTKGPAVCTHGTGYRQGRLEGALLAKFREALTAPMIDALARMVNAQLDAVFQGQDARTAELPGEMDRLEGQARHLVRLLAIGGDSPAVRAELRTIETTLEGRRAEWTTIEKAAALPAGCVPAAGSPARQGRDPEASRWRPGDRAPAVHHRRAAGRDQRSRKKRQPPEGSGGCLPTGGCGGWI